MPPTPGGEWAVARFQIDGMYSNDNHRRVIDPAQQYRCFYFTLNGAVNDESVIDLDWVVVWRGEDKRAPQAPGEVTLTRAGEQATLAWAAAQDNLQVSHYEIVRRDGEAWKQVTIATGTKLSVPAGELPDGAYGVRAVDVAGNASAVAPAQAP